MTNKQGGYAIDRLPPHLQAWLVSLPDWDTEDEQEKKVLNRLQSATPTQLEVWVDSYKK